MEINTLLDNLVQKGVLSDEKRRLLQAYEENKPVSLYVFVQILLYVSISAFVGGVGVVVYDNIETVGHAVLIAALALLTVACFAFVFVKSTPYQPGKVEQTTPYFDAVLLLGCLLFLALEGYVQYQYEVFGNRYGLATFLPAVLFFFLAYRFDHQGVLSLAVAALASWVGLSVAPEAVLIANDFSDPKVIHLAILFGVVVVGSALLLARQGIKRHFTYTYLLVAGGLYLTACTGGLFTQETGKWAYALGLGLGCWLFYRYALQEDSLVFLLIGVMFAYVGFTYLFFDTFPEVAYSLNFLYMLFSAGAVVVFFMNYKKWLGRD